VCKDLSLTPLTLPSITAFAMFRLRIKNEASSTHHLFQLPPPTPNSNAVADPDQIAHMTISAANPPPLKTRPPFPHLNRYGINVSIPVSMFYPGPFQAPFYSTVPPAMLLQCLDPGVAFSSHDPLVHACDSVYNTGMYQYFNSLVSKKDDRMRMEVCDRAATFLN